MIRPVAAIDGAASGRAIRQKAPQWPAPSTSAASSSSTGRSRKVWRRMTTTKGRMKVALIRIRREMRVEQAERAHDEVERDDGGHGGSTRWDRNQTVMSLLVQHAEAEARERVGGRRAERRSPASRRRDGDHRAVGRSAAAVSGVLQLVDPVVERRREVDPRDAEPGDGEGVERVAQAGRERPVDREEEDRASTHDRAARAMA